MVKHEASTKVKAKTLNKVGVRRIMSKRSRRKEYLQKKKIEVVTSQERKVADSRGEGGES